MISRLDIEERVREWGLRENVVEKDYVLGWVLWGIGSDPTLSASWAFKGGTCLKKCFLETYRFSEDLDFSVLPKGPIKPDEVLPLLANVLQRISNETGIDFTREAPKLKYNEKWDYTEGRIYYIGPRQTPTAASIILDLNAREQVVRPTVLKKIGHSYPDTLPDPGHVRCYSFEELFAEKLRAMGERGRPRDLYDIINLYRRDDLQAQAAPIRQILAEKCQTKGIPIPTLAAIMDAPHHKELESEWENMLAHQLPALPSLQDFLSELPGLFAWIEGATERVPLPIMPSLPIEGGEAVEAGWRPPPTVQTWKFPVPLETIRFAAANHLCVDLGYQGSMRTIEPYSLRRTGAGHLLLYAVRSDTGENRSYRVDRIQSVKVSRRTFRPRFRVEFSATGPVRPTGTVTRSTPLVEDVRAGSGPFHVVQCPQCSKVFYRHSMDTRLNNHKRKGGGSWCSGSGGYGRYIGMRHKS